MLWVSNFSLSLSSIGVTFLSPNKKVTKEVGIGEALMPRCRATNCVLPYVPYPHAPKNCMTFSRRDGTSSRSC